MILCMLFVPKMRFQWEILHQTEEHTVISGLEPGKVTVAPPVDLLHVQTMNHDNDTHTQPSSADGSDRESFGEKILTTKTTEELAREVGILRFTVVQAQKHILEQGETIARLQRILKQNGLKCETVPGTVDATRISEVASQLDPSSLMSPFVMSNNKSEASHTREPHESTNNEEKVERTSDEESSE